MTVRFGSRGRLAILAFALVQLALPGVLTVADGWTTYAAGPRAHLVRVEQFGHTGGVRVHQADTCAVCQFLAHATPTRPRPPALILAGRQVNVVHVCAGVSRAAAERRWTALPRAPPLA